MHVQGAPAAGELVASGRIGGRFGLVAAAVIVAAILFLFATAPRDGQFWWSDAPRHALNGAFLLDFLRELPLADPQRWAIDYYLHYPALTILFYPPMFPAAEAMVFAVFGVSPASAVLTVTFFYAALAAGAWRLARRWLPEWEALACTILFLGLPEIALWGRQVMLEIPAFAFLVWSLVAFFRYTDTGRRRALALAMLLFLGALYTKQSVFFLLPALAAFLLAKRGLAVLRDRHLLLCLAGFGVLLLPLAFLTVKFGAGNVQSVTGIADAEVSRRSLAGWIFYLRQMPHQTGWVVFALAALYPLVALLRRDWRLPPPELLFLGAWLGIGYLFFSAIDLKEPRHTVFLLFPLALAAVLSLRRLAGTQSAAATMLVALGGFAYTIAFCPVPAVDGYREAAEWVRGNVPPGPVVFSGERDGAFIFNMRTLDPARAYTIIRADKLLLRISIRRTLGVEEKPVDPEGIGELLNSHAAGYVIAQRDFWTDLPSMRAFQNTLEGGQFSEVQRIAVGANVPHADRELRIYRNAGPLADPPAKLRLDLPIINRSFEGGIGAAGAQ
jgi:hypothetical protein